MIVFCLRQQVNFFLFTTAIQIAGYIEIIPNLMNCYLLNDTSAVKTNIAQSSLYDSFLYDLDGSRYFYDPEMWVKVNPLSQIDSKGVPLFIAFS